MRVVERMPTEGSNRFYVGNRSPLLPSPLIKLPTGSVKPKGWLETQLKLMANGLLGRLPEISPWCKWEGNAWANPKGEGHSHWEELPYWLRGFTALAYITGDQKLSLKRASGLMPSFQVKTKAGILVLAKTGATEICGLTCWLLRSCEPIMRRRTTSELSRSC